MESKLRGVSILFVFVLSTILIFGAEQKFLLTNIDPKPDEYASVPNAGSIKYILNDFEKYADGDADFLRKRFFSFGSATPTVTHNEIQGNGFISSGILKVNWNHAFNYGGWGQGFSQVMNLDTDNDFLNLFVYVPASNSLADSIRIILEEDDTKNGYIEKDLDDSWSFDFKAERKEEWQLISIPLKTLKDYNPMQGDGKFNVSPEDGKLVTMIISLLHGENYTDKDKWYFDFISFSRGPLMLKTTNKNNNDQN